MIIFIPPTKPEGQVVGDSGDGMIKYWGEVMYMDPLPLTRVQVHDITITLNTTTTATSTYKQLIIPNTAHTTSTSFTWNISRAYNMAEGKRVEVEGEQLAAITIIDRLKIVPNIR